MRNLVAVAAIAALTGGATGVRAADLGPPPEPLPLPPPPVLTNWSGFYLGLGVGGASATTSVSRTDGFYWTTPVHGATYEQTVVTKDWFDLGAQGVLGTVQVGYDYQLPISRWVAGVFADYDWDSLSGEHNTAPWVGAWLNGVPADPWLDFLHPPAGNVKVEFDNAWAVGGRLGYLFTPETLIYGMAAYTQGQATVSGVFHNHWQNAFFPVPPANPLAWPAIGFSDTVTTGGWAVGVGAETRLIDNWYLKLEYRFSSFDSGRVLDFYSGLYDVVNGGPVGACPGGGTCAADYRRIDASTDVQSARLSLTYKFGRRTVIEPFK